MVDTPSDRDLEYRYWIHGFLLQTIAYGVNVVFFLMCTYALTIHIMKATQSHRFHRLHLVQNCFLMVYVAVMFAFATLVMVHQGIMGRGAWYMLLDYSSRGAPASPNVVQLLLNMQIAMQRACDAAFFLANWGATSFLLWRCLVHWKANSVFPRKIMALPYLSFLACVVTGVLQIINDTAPSVLPPTTRNIDWLLIHWGISTGLYYLLSLLIVGRIFYHRYVLKVQIGSHRARFTNYLTILIESGILLLAFATVHLVVLIRHRNLQHLLQMPLLQLQVLIPLMIVQRMAAGKAWSGKTVDCLLQKDPEPPSLRLEEVSTMGFNPNTEISSTQNDDLSHNTNKGHEPCQRLVKEQKV